MFNRRSFFGALPALAVPLPGLVEAHPVRYLDEEDPLVRMRAFLHVFETKGAGCGAYLETANGLHLRSRIIGVDCHSPTNLTFNSVAHPRNIERDYIRATVLTTPVGQFVHRHIFPSSIRCWDISQLTVNHHLFIHYG